ncbi:hypothetical protein [Luteibacter sp. 9133]|uniref:DUF6984 family protein n=1 Tax=Luteibacter sp. 9133 TaxID=1500891 RepID=UPI0005BAB70F|nr:hypothetical protein [Luteibacter sp. 9133]
MSLTSENLPNVFALYHVHSIGPGAGDVKDLGMHASRANAESSIAAYLDLPGFRRTPDGFRVIAYAIDVLLWPMGFALADGLPGLLARHSPEGVAAELAEVHVVWHEFEEPAEIDHERVVGVFSTRALAEEAVAASRRLPGFADYPDGFMTGAVTLGERGWTEGFATVDGREPPSLSSLLAGCSGRITRRGDLALLDVAALSDVLVAMGDIGVRPLGINGFVSGGHGINPDPDQTLDLSGCATVRCSLDEAQRFVGTSARADRLYELVTADAGRPLLVPERALLVHVIGKAGMAEPEAAWLDALRVTDLANGGLGGFRVVFPEPGDYTRAVSDFAFDDSDGVQVQVRLNVDDDGMPYELEMSRVDSQPLQSLPKDWADG